MKSAFRAGCWTVLAFVVAMGALVLLFANFRQEQGSQGSVAASGNLTIFGEDVEIGQGEIISGNLLVIGDDLTMEGQIDGNLVVAGGDAVLSKNALVRGNVSLLGGDLVITSASQVDGNVAVAGGDALLSTASRVLGNVKVVGGRLAHEPDVFIGGGVNGSRYSGTDGEPRPPNPPPLPPARFSGTAGEPPSPEDSPVFVAVRNSDFRAELDSIRLQVENAAEESRHLAELAREEAQKLATDAQKQSAPQGQVIQFASAGYQEQYVSPRRNFLFNFLIRLLQAFLWTLLITALVLLFCWLLPTQIKRISVTAERETALSFATGAIAVLASALLAIILTITVCFALLAFPLLAVVALVILCGWTVTCFWLGHRLDAFLAARANLSWHPLVSVGLCSLFVTGIVTFAWAIFACLGFILALLLGSTGAGAVIVHLARRSDLRLPGDPSPGPDAPQPQDSVASAPPGGDTPK